jgi:hypothetical protein
VPADYQQNPSSTAVNSQSAIPAFQVCTLVPSLQQGKPRQPCSPSCCPRLLLSCCSDLSFIALANPSSVEQLELLSHSIAPGWLHPLSSPFNICTTFLQEFLNDTSSAAALTWAYYVSSHQQRPCPLSKRSPAPSTTLRYMSIPYVHPYVLYVHPIMCNAQISFTFMVAKGL